MSVKVLTDLPREKQPGLTAHVPIFDYKSEDRHYMICDYPSDTAFVKKVVLESQQLDAAVLVVSLTGGRVPSVRRSNSQNSESILPSNCLDKRIS